MPCSNCDIWSCIRHDLGSNILIFCWSYCYSKSQNYSQLLHGLHLLRQPAFHSHQEQSFTSSQNKNCRCVELIHLSLFRMFPAIPPLSAFAHGMALIQVRLVSFSLQAYSIITCLIVPDSIFCDTNTNKEKELKYIQQI